MKHFLDFLKKESTEFRTPLMTTIIAAGIVNGIGVTVAVQSVGSIQPGEVNPRAFLLFMACIVGYWLAKERVLNRTTVVLEQIIERMRLRILGKIRETELLPFEGMDKGRIYATLSNDAVSISNSAGLVINASSSLVMLVFTFILLACISVNALIMTAGLIGIEIFYYMRHSKSVHGHFASATQQENEFFDNLNGLLSGFKEIKLDRDKGNDYFREEIERIVRSTRGHRVDAGKALNHSLILAHTYIFFTLGGLIYVLPVLSPSEAAIIPMLVPVILFASGPLADVVSAIPALARAEAAIVNIRNLEEGVDKRLAETRQGPELPQSSTPPAVFESLRCEGLSFEYPNGGKRPFKVQPVDFEIKAGQIVFIVGGNGSGKSTLLKLLTGLYPPDAGLILLNGEEIHAGNVNRLREMFSPIFTDFYLFKRLLGRQKEDEKRIAELLTRMELADKTSIGDGRVTNLNLSTGQRKRLALVLSTLDDRPIHLFDEWAADQDPIFRKYFYEVLLRQMAKEGRTILAVTHDDHYFHCADKVYTMEYGKLTDYVPVVRGS